MYNHRNALKEGELCITLLLLQLDEQNQTNKDNLFSVRTIKTSKMSDWTSNKKKSQQENNFIPKHLSLGHWAIQKVGLSHQKCFFFFCRM